MLHYYREPVGLEIRYNVSAKGALEWISIEERIHILYQLGWNRGKECFSSLGSG